MNDLLKISEVARILRVDYSTVRRWIGIGALESVLLPRIGPRQGYRVKRTALNKILGETPTDLKNGSIQSSEYDVYIAGFGVEHVGPSGHSGVWRIGNEDYPTI